MLSKEKLEIYRKMTVEERMRLVVAMTEEGVLAMFEGDPQLVKKRFELLHRENELRNLNMLSTLAKTKEHG